MRLLITLLFFCFNAFSQRTVSQTLATNYDPGTSGSAIIGPVKNVGQVSHLFTFLFKDNPAVAPVTCTTPISGSDYKINLIASPFPIATKNSGYVIPYRVVALSTLAALPNRITTSIATDFITPYLYVNFFNYNQNQCLVDIYYSGSYTSIQKVEKRKSVIPEDLNDTFIWSQTITAGATTKLTTYTGAGSLNILPQYLRVNVLSIRIGGVTATPANPAFVQFLEVSAAGPTVRTFPIPSSGNTIYGGDGVWYSTLAGSQIHIQNASATDINVMIEFEFSM